MIGIIISVIKYPTVDPFALNGIILPIASNSVTGFSDFAMSLNNDVCYLSPLSYCKPAFFWRKKFFNVV